MAGAVHDFAVENLGGGASLFSAVGSQQGVAGVPNPVEWIPVVESLLVVEVGCSEEVERRLDEDVFPTADEDARVRDSVHLSRPAGSSVLRIPLLEVMHNFTSRMRQRVRLW